MSSQTQSTHEQGSVGTKPIEIGARRRRSSSISSSSSFEATTPESPIRSPILGSPILSLVMNQNSPPGTAKLAKRNTSSFSANPVFEDEEEEEQAPVVQLARRRASLSVAGPPRLPVMHAPAPPELEKRGSNILRRLSLSSGARPPVNSVSPTARDPAVSASRISRSATVSGEPSVAQPKPLAPQLSVPSMPAKRAPSPMGERILKGQFDGFN